MVMSRLKQIATERLIVNAQIRDKCGDQLEINVQKGSNPRLIIYNVPDAVTPGNAEALYRIRYGKQIFLKWMLRSR
jgi:hypothetical protein